MNQVATSEDWVNEVSYYNFKSTIIGTLEILFTRLLFNHIIDDVHIIYKIVFISSHENICYEFLGQIME